MNKRLKKTLLLLVTVVATNRTISQTEINLSYADNDLSISLAYFGQNAPEAEIRRAVREVQERHRAVPINDSLAASLINLECLLNDRLDENLYLNYKPYKWEMLLSLYENTASLLRQLPSEKESLHYASALYNFAAMIMHYSPIERHRYNVVDLMENAFRIREKTLAPDDPDYLESIYGLALAYSTKGEREKAFSLAQTAVSGLAGEEGKAKTVYAEALLLLATLYTTQHKYQDAANLLEQENIVRKEILGAESSSYALRLYVAGDLTMYTGEYERSFSYFTKALRLTKETLGKENLQYAFCLYGLGSVYYVLADYKEAVPLFQQSLAIKEGLFGKEYIDVALSVHMLAKTYERMGLYAQAFPLFQRATAIVKKAVEEGREHAFNYGFSLKNLAGIYQELHQYAPAYALLQKAASLTETTTDGWFYAMALQNLSLLFEKVNRYDSALHYMKKVVGFQQQKWGTEHIEFASALDQLSNLYAKMNMADKALLLCHQAAGIRKLRLSETHPDYALSLNHLGDFYASTGRFDSANHYLRKALCIREQTLGTDHPDYAKTLISLGKLAVAEGEEEKATDLFTHAGSLWLTFLKRTYISLSEQEKINLLNGEDEVFGYLPSLLCDNKQLLANVVQKVYSAEMLLKGMVLDDQQQVLNSIRQSKDSVAAALYFSWRANRALLAKQYFLPVTERTASFDSLQKYTDELDEELSRRSAFFQQQKAFRSLTVKDIGDVLKTGEAAIEFIRFRYQHPNPTDSILYAAILVLPGDSTGTFVPLFEERQLKLLLQSSAGGEPWAIKKLYPGKKENLADGRSSSLYRLIWKPLQAHLEQIHTIYFAPAGLLHRVAFAALYTETHELLLTKYNLNQVLSTRSLLLARPTFAKPSSVSLWASAMDKDVENTAHTVMSAQKTQKEIEHLHSLPGTGEEIRGIVKICSNAGVHTTVLSGEMATEEKFKELDGNSPAALHVATHGFYARQQEAEQEKVKGNEEDMPLANAMLGSSLLMAQRHSSKKESVLSHEADDGILTAYEIAQMDMSKTKFVVLSACNTALGELQGEEGVLGLQRALKMAGVRQMIIGLWKVPDKETAELMQAFYKTWLGGKEPREALRTAQLQMKQKYPPFYWAAFVIIE